MIYDCNCKMLTLHAYRSDILMTWCAADRNADRNYYSITCLNAVLRLT